MKLNGKQKSYLRGLAQTLKPMFQIGKEGLSSDVLQAISDYIVKNELGKISILDTCSETKDEIVAKIDETGMQVIQVIGNNLIIFKRNPKKEDGIRFPR